MLMGIIQSSKFFSTVIGNMGVFGDENKSVASKSPCKDFVLV
jgi:hypothetical protein